jgi:predicted enzyme related to lactoylglutathione lyase
MLNLSAMIGSAQPKALAEFYEKVLGKPADWAESGWYGWQVGSTSFGVGEHSEVKGKAKEPQRVIINFETDEVKAEFKRIKGLGAQVVKEPYEMEGMWIATFADPDGITSN